MFVPLPSIGTPPCRSLIRQCPGIVAPPTAEGEHGQTNAGEPRVVEVQSVSPLCIEGRPVQEREHEVAVHEVELNQRRCEVGRRKLRKESCEEGRRVGLETFPL
jgi:hypothetical protein